MIKRMIMRWGVGVVAILITVALSKLLPEVFKLAWKPAWHIIIFIPVFAVTNAIMGFLPRLIFAPLTCMTLGLFGLVINALMFWIAGAATGANMNFVSALFGSIVYTVICAPLSYATREKRSE